MLLAACTSREKRRIAVKCSKCCLIVDDGSSKVFLMLGVGVGLGLGLWLGVGLGVGLVSLSKYTLLEPSTLIVYMYIKILVFLQQSIKVPIVFTRTFSSKILSFVLPRNVDARTSSTLI